MIITYLIALFHKKTPVYAEDYMILWDNFFTYHEIKISIVLCRHIYDYQIWFINDFWQSKTDKIFDTNKKL